MSNLPPGVTEGMLPGNRPEDEANDRFYEALYDRLADYGLELPEGWDALGSDGAIAKAVEIARNLGHAEGFEAGRFDAMAGPSMEQLEIEAGNVLTDGSPSE